MKWISRSIIYTLFLALATFAAPWASADDSDDDMGLGEFTVMDDSDSEESGILESDESDDGVDTDSDSDSDGDDSDSDGIDSDDSDGELDDSDSEDDSDPDDDGEGGET